MFYQTRKKFIATYPFYKQHHIIKLKYLFFSIYRLKIDYDKLNKFKNGVIYLTSAKVFLSFTYKSYFKKVEKINYKRKRKLSYNNIN